MKKYLFICIFWFCLPKLSCCQTQLITDGGFESSATWYSPSYFQYGTGPNPHSGLGYAYLADFSGFPADGINGLISQTFYIPNGTSDLDISFYFKITTQETTTSVIYDNGYAYLENVNNPSIQILLFNYSNLDATSYYQYAHLTTNATAGQSWRIKFFAQNDGSLPSVFRIDDVSIIANSSIPSSCITWSGGITPTMNVDTSMELLCANNIISNFQDASSLNNTISKLEIAECVGKALFGNTTNIQFVDNFPNVYPELEFMTNVDEKRYIKMMHFLEYPSPINPSLETDNVSPFKRNYFYHNYYLGIKKSDAIKAVLEAFNIQPYMVNYDPTSASYSPLVCDLLESHINLGWVQKAKNLGLLDNNFVSPCTGSSIYFGTDNNITYKQFYLILAKALYHLPTSISYNDFYIPHQFDYKTTGNPMSLEKGVINHYSDNSFSIPAGTFNLEFTHSYHSNLTEFPTLEFDVDFENKHWLSKLEPLGAGWTHNYNIYLRYFEQLLTSPERCVIYWPDGAIHSYLIGQNKYETKGITDKLTVNLFTPGGQPSEITILKGRMEYVFRLIDPSSHVLMISEIRNAFGDKLDFTYQNGTGPTPSLLLQVLSTVEDTYSGRKLEFSYWPNTNYLKEVKDPINRKLQFFENTFTHELDSFIDAKVQRTKYEVYDYAGSRAYRTHLVGQIQYPKGNYVMNHYNRKKVYQIDQATSVIDISSIPNYQNPWTTQNSKVQVTQSNQTINFNYQFDILGNVFKFSSGSDSIIRTYDTTSGFMTSENDLLKGIKTTIGYDINGFENKKVILDSVYNDSIKYTIVNNSYGEPTEFTDYNDPTSSTPTITKLYRDPTGYIYKIATHEGTSDEVVHEFTPNTHGQLKQYISPIGHYTHYIYNNFGDMILKESEPNILGTPNLKEYYTYDHIGRNITVTNAQGENLKNEYDENDNLHKQRLDTSGLNLTTFNHFDENDNHIVTVSPKGNATTWYYDFNKDILTREVDGINTKRYTYNQDNSLDSFITKNNHVFKYHYFDTFMFPGTEFKGMLRSDGSTSFNYHTVTKNFKWAMNISNGKKIEYKYQNPQASYYKRGRFDKPETISTDGYVTCNDEIYYLYNKALQPLSIQTLNILGGQAGYKFTYDHTTKKLDSIKLFNGNKFVANYDYLKDGKIIKKVLGNGDTVLYFYDEFGRQSGITAVNKNNVVLYWIHASLDSAGRHTSENVQIFFNGSLDTSLPILANGSLASNTYNSQNRLTNANGSSVTSNNDGSMLTYGSGITTGWNDYNQLAIFYNSINFLNFEYDGLGNRRSIDTTFFIVDVANTGNTFLETDINCNVKSMYVWGDDGLVCRTDGNINAIFYYHFDFRGSVICITDSGGNMVKLYKYDEFGNIYKEDGSMSWKNPYRYIGKYGVEYDDKDLYYMKARYYMPKEGRFISEDPKFNTNLFVYADDDPINKIDPKGKSAYHWLDNFLKNSGINSNNWFRFGKGNVLVNGAKERLYRFAWGSNANYKYFNNIPKYLVPFNQTLRNFGGGHLILQDMIGIMSRTPILPVIVIPQNFLPQPVEAAELNYEYLPDHGVIETIYYPTEPDFGIIEN